MNLKLYLSISGGLANYHGISSAPADAYGFSGASDDAYGVLDEDFGTFSLWSYRTLH